MAAQSAGQRTRDVDDLQEQVTELMGEVDRYRTACEDTLQQLDWCIGYFAGCNKRGLAKALSVNRSAIRRHLMGRQEQPLPIPDTNKGNS